MTALPHPVGSRDVSPPNCRRETIQSSSSPRREHKNAHEAYKTVKLTLFIFSLELGAFGVSAIVEFNIVSTELLSIVLTVMLRQA